MSGKIPDPAIDPENPREAFRTVLALLNEQKAAQAKLQARINSLSIAVNTLVALLANSKAIDKAELEELMGKSGARLDQLKIDA